jgi:glutathione S-transferase
MWLLEELNLPYTLKVYKRAPMLAPPELRKVHPLGKSPVLEVEVPGQEKPFVIAESGVIVEYLLDHWGKQMIPTKWKPGQEDQPAGETDEWMRYRYFMHYAEGSLMPPLVIGLVLSRKFSSVRD